MRGPEGVGAACGVLLSPVTLDGRTHDTWLEGQPNSQFLTSGRAPTERKWFHQLVQEASYAYTPHPLFSLSRLSCQ